MTLEERFAVEDIEAELTRLRSENIQQRGIIEGMGKMISGAREEIEELKAEVDEWERKDANERHIEHLTMEARRTLYDGEGKS